MPAPRLPVAPPSRDGVGPSCVALPPGPWPTVLDFLAERFAAIPRARWHARMAQGEVTDEQGAAVPPSRRYQAHQRLHYFREVPHEPPIPFQATVLYADAHLLVVDKPHFLPVTPSGQYLQETLLVRLRRQFGQDALCPIHRIDRDTAGLVLMSRQKSSRAAYQALFRQRQVHKHYEAIAPWRADLALPLRRHTRLAEGGHFMLQQEVAGAPNALTFVTLIERCPNAPELARYRLQPVTGQRHQLRVHMAALGLPILGDGLYPRLLPQDALDYARPLQLLAKSLAFTDPLGGQPRHFESQRQLDGASWGGMPTPAVATTRE